MTHYNLNNLTHIMIGGFICAAYFIKDVSARLCYNSHGEAKWCSVKCCSESSSTNICCYERDIYSSIYWFCGLSVVLSVCYFTLKWVCRSQGRRSQNIASIPHYVGSNSRAWDAPPSYIESVSFVNSVELSQRQQRAPMMSTHTQYSVSAHVPNTLSPPTLSNRSAPNPGISDISAWSVVQQVPPQVQQSTPTMTPDVLQAQTTPQITIQDPMGAEYAYSPSAWEPGVPPPPYSTVAHIT